MTPSSKVFHFQKDTFISSSDLGFMPAKQRFPPSVGSIRFVHGQISISSMLFRHSPLCDLPITDHYQLQTLNFSVSTEQLGFEVRNLLFHFFVGGCVNNIAGHSRFGWILLEDNFFVFEESFDVLSFLLGVLVNEIH